MALYTLYVQYAGRPPETKSFDKEAIVLGRDVGDIALQDPQVSGRHAEMRFQGGRLVFQDLGSTNGSFLPSGERVQAPVELGIGQAIRCGQSVITVQHIDFPGAVGQGKTMFAGAGSAPPPAAAPAAPQPFAPPAAPPIPGAGAGAPVGARPAGPPPGPPRPGMPGGPAPMAAPVPAPAPMAAPAPAPMAAPAPAPMAPPPGQPGMAPPPGQPGMPPQGMGQAPGGMPGAPPQAQAPMGQPPGQPQPGQPQMGQQPGYPGQAPGQPPGQPGYAGQQNAMQPAAQGNDPFAGADSDGFIADVKAGFALLKPVLVPVVLVLGSFVLPLVGFAFPLLAFAAAIMLVRSRLGMPVSAGAAIKQATGDLVNNWISGFLAIVVPFAGMAGGLPSMVIERREKGDALSRGIEILKLDIGRVVLGLIVAGIGGQIVASIGMTLWGLIPYVGWLFGWVLLMAGYGFALGLMIATGLHQYFMLRKQHEGADVEAEARAAMEAMDAGAPAPPIAPAGGGYPQPGQQPGQPAPGGFGQPAPGAQPAPGGYPQPGQPAPQAPGGYPAPGQQPAPGGYPQQGQPAPGGYPQPGQPAPAPGGYPQPGQPAPAPGGYPQQGQPAPGGYPQPGQQQPAPGYPQPGQPAPGGYPQQGQPAPGGYPQPGQQQPQQGYPPQPGQQPQQPQQGYPPQPGYPPQGGFPQQ